MSKLSKRLLSWMLLVAMLCTLLPTAVFADDSATTSGDDDFYKIVHVDAGRKYFSPANINLIIDNAAAAGFNQVELYLSDNQGFRFALDNMTVTTDYGTYDLTPALGDGYSDGSKYPDYSGKYLTQSEMTEIIAYAETKGIEIVPCINVPGHMGAILEEFSDFRYTSGNSTSQSSIDLANEQAVAFALALTEKYVGYFAGQGLKYYNVGADEYANDLSSMGFEGMGTDLYTKFVEFLNDAADIVIAAGMTPRAFNDGFYYKDYSISVEPNKAYEVCYWSSGWSGYDVAAASTIAAKGHKMINTHGDYYWVLGNSSWQCSASKASGFDYTVFQGSTISDPDGAMFCIWCDVGNADGTDYGSGVVADTADVIAAFGATLPATETSEPEVEEPVAIPNAPTTITVGNSVVLSVDEAATWTSSNEAVVTIKEAQLQDVEGASVEIKAVGAGTATISAVTESGTTYASGVTVVAEDTDATIKDTVASNGGTAASYELDTDGLDSGSEYLIVYQSSSSATTGIALNNSKGSATVSISNSKATITDESEASSVLWTYSSYSYGTTYYYLSNESNYLYPSVSNSGGGFPGNQSNKTYTLNISTSRTGVKLSGSNGVYTIASSNNGAAYVTYTSSWGAAQTGVNLYFYKYTESTETYTVTPSLQESRIKDLTVSIDGYTDESWSAYQSALTTAQSKLEEVEAASYSTEAAANTALNELIAAVDALETAKNNLKKAITITVNYQVDGATVKTETYNVAEDATSVTLTTTSFNANNKYYTVNNTTLALTAGQTTYNVAVTETDEDLSAVTPLEIEYWITNAQLTDPNTNLSYLTINATDSGIYAESGVAFADLVPETINQANRDREYWQTRMLDVTETNTSSSGTEHQTQGPGDDETTNGDLITRVRYWNGSWQVLVGTEWLSVDTSTASAQYMDTESNVTYSDRTRHQLVAYYMEILDIQNSNGTTELHTNVADWGKKGDGSEADDYLDPNAYCSISIQIVYEDGATNPSANTAAALNSKTVVYGYWSEGRGIGTLNFDGLDQFQIYKVTAETGSVSASFGSGAWGSVTVNSLTWDDNEKTVWQDDPTQKVSIANNAKYPSNTDPYDNLMWDENQEAILIRVYVKALASEDALTVHYLDRSAGDLEFYNYNIAVQKGENFAENFAMGTETNTLVNNTVTNYYGTEQTVAADLASMPQIAAYYRYCDYTLVEAVRSTDGKDVYLYYTFTPVVSFVVDFGLPLEITPDDLNPGGYEDGDVKGVKVIGSYDTEASSTANAEYGTLSVSGTTVTYTPDEILTGVDFFTVYVITTLDDESTNVTNEEAGIAYRVYVFPANNVMYEETFATDVGLTNTTGTGATAWKQTGTQTATTQDTPDTSTDVYGYDSHYASNSGYSNGTVYWATVNQGATTFPTATYTFTGTGFELMSECSANTGTIVAALYQVNADGSETAKKLYIIDTSFTGAFINSAGNTVNSTAMTYQIPVVQNLSLDYGTYKLVVRGRYRAPTTGDTASSLAVDDSYGAAIAAEVGFDGFTDIEVVRYDVNGNEVETGDSLYASATAGTVVYLDGIRVYKPLGTDPTAYVATEKNTTFYSAYKVATDWNDSIVYVEDVSGQETYTQAEYTHNGPNNEIYLMPGTGIGFKVTASTAASATVQINAKTITGAPTLAWAAAEGTSTNSYTALQTNLTSQTAMYYTVDTVTSGGNTYVYIANTGAENSILSLVDIKVANGTIDTTSATSEDELVVLSIANNMQPWENPFKDVTETKWYFEELKHLNIHGIINGMTNTQFGPSVTTDRAMIVTTLWRMEGQPEADAEVPFSDVRADKYYTEAVAWAAENDIVNGYPDGTFKPKQAITRQEIVAILYRYAAYKGCDMSGAADLTQFTDVNTVNSYAKEPMAWAVANGIIKGYDENGVMTLKPKNNATRAELAVMLYRIINYCARN